MSFSYYVVKYFDGMSVRQYLEWHKLSSKKVNTIVNEKKYLINESNTNNIIHEGDTLTIFDIFSENEVSPIFQDIDVLYLDEHILIVEKSDNLIIHSDNPNDITLDRIVSGIMVKNGLKPIPRHIYRLDRDTTGIMVYALDPLTFAKMNNDVENKTCKKTYYAITSSNIPDSGTIDKPIGKDRHINSKMVISKNGKESITNYKVIGKNEKFALLKVNLETGRTHQIRLHLSSIGFPIVGDSLYGSKINKKMQLQATSIRFNHPIKKIDLTFTVKSKLSL